MRTYRTIEFSTDAAADAAFGVILVTRRIKATRFYRGRLRISEMEYRSLAKEIGAAKGADLRAWNVGEDGVREDEICLVRA